MKNLTHRRAKISDLPRLIERLLEDERYIKAFHKIDSDPAQYLMVVKNSDEIIGTCHLTIIPSLTFIGSTRMQIEAVRVAGKYRGQKIGSWMFDQAMSYATAHDGSIVSPQ